MSENSVPGKIPEKPAGILRLDLNKPRRLSAEFKFFQGEPASPQPSVDRLSVTFAEDSVRSDSLRCNFFSPGSSKMDKVHFPSAPTEDDSDQEDYSASVNAIIQRKTSTKKPCRRNSRGASSSFSPDILPGTENGRRRSSVFTTSSGDTAITMDDNLAAEVTQDEIFENIKLHKEVLSNVKMQPWNMRKKLKLVVQAKAYIKKHEGALQERLAQSHSTRDMIASWNIYLIKKWQHWRREMLNLSMWFIPWELKIKEIESHFGSVVASYFIFLRWMFWVNLVIAVVLISFVAIPEMLMVDLKTDGGRKFTLEEEKYNATNFLTLWDFEGVFKYSPLFYGWYTNNDSANRFYRLPFAYFMTGLVVYAYSFFATLRKMAENSRMSKLSEKDDECIFSWKLFTAWDYMIGNAETAHNRVASIVMGFKEALLEEAEKKRESRKWKIVCFRAFVNLVVLGLLFFSAFAVVMVVKRSTEKEANSTVWRKNEITIVMSLITLFFPMLFEVLGLMEQYHPRKQLRLQLARIMVLNLLNLYSLIFALFDKISFMTSELHNFKNISCTEPTESPNPITYSTQASYYNSSNIFNDTEKMNPLVSYSLVYDMTYNASNFTDLTLKQFIDLIRTSFTDLSMSNITTFDSLTTDYPENISLINDTDNLFLKPYFPNISVLNETFLNFTEYNITDFKNMFVDYLTYLLSTFINNTTDFNNSTVTNIDTLNITSTNYTDFLGNNFYMLKSVLMSLFENITRKYDEEKVDQELTTFYNEIITTAISLQNNITSTDNPVCQITTIPSTSVSTSSTPLPAAEVITGNYSMCARLRSLCWETMFGQELIKLTVMDLVMTILSTLSIDFFRGIFVRVMNRCWCWDLEKKFPQYGDFKVAENILHLVNNQGMVWMGMFFSPGLVVLNVIKLYIMMYFRAWAVLTCNVPHEVIFRASRSNNFYYALLLMMLFLCVLPVGYAIVWIKPSWHCGPFSRYKKIFHIFTETIRDNVPEPFQRALDYIASPGIVIPLLVLLTLIIYYLISLTGALREANEDLKIQLRRERTEERRKMFQIVDRRRGAPGESNESSNTPITKWKKLLGSLPSGKSFDDTPKQQSEDLPQPIKEEKVESKNKDFLVKFIKKALGKSSTSEEEQNADTDTEQHDSLPYDTNASRNLHKSVRPSLSWNNSDFQSVVSKALKANRSKLSNLSRGSVDSVDLKQFSLQRYDNLEMKRKFADSVVHSTSKDMRQDSGSSVWSENIPVITISKTESAENILTEMNTNIDIDSPPKNVKNIEESKFKPKIRSVLKKQSTEVDEDTICYFSRDLENNLKENRLIKAVAEGDIEGQNTCKNIDIARSFQKHTEDISDQSSSEDTEFKETSVDTILNFPSNTEKNFSSEEKTISDDSIENLS